MTSTFLDRVNQHDKWYKADDCVFCDIISGNTEAYVVAETEMYMAFLDIPVSYTHLTLPTKRIV